MACLVGKADIDRTPAAKTALQTEWDRRRSNGVWDAAHPRDWDEVGVEAKKHGITVHMGYLSEC